MILKSNSKNAKLKWRSKSKMTCISKGRASRKGKEREMGAKKVKLLRRKSERMKESATLIKWCSKKTSKTISTIRRNSLKKPEEGEKLSSRRGRSRLKWMMLMITLTKIKSSPTQEAIINIRMLTT